MTTRDTLAPLLDLADVSDAIESARSAADAVLGLRALRPATARVARIEAEVTLRDAVASASLEGTFFDLEAVRAGTVTDPVVQGALRVGAELVGLAPRWLGTPPQVLTRLHILAARGVVADPGRPTSGMPAGAAERSPRSSGPGQSALPSDGTPRLLALSSVLGSPAPALLRAAVVQGELLSLRAFEGPNGVVARAAGRLTLIAAGLDPRGLLPVSVGHSGRGPEYVGAAGAYATGTRDGLRAWIKHCAAAVATAATELELICSEIS
jgi:hypothetical protein